MRLFTLKRFFKYNFGFLKRNCSRTNIEIILKIPSIDSSRKFEYFIRIHVPSITILLLMKTTFSV